jgi:GLPGLI family protein
VEDSIPNIQWKITNEHREIAGYNCRKAVGKIMDDVYGIYTDDITISGGPCFYKRLLDLIS